ncbi:MAG: trimethylamine methyltransferase family protein [Candidatus Latescibacterota bacterium]
MERDSCFQWHREDAVRAEGDLAHGTGYCQCFGEHTRSTCERALSRWQQKGNDNMNAIKELSESQIEKIHHEAENLLAHTGFRVKHEEVLRRARAAGAHVDEAEQIVRIPTPLLRELLAQVPSSYEAKGLNETSYTIGGGEQHSLAIVTDPWIIDYKTQRPRRPCLEDVRRHTIIAQKLDTVAGISRMDFPVTDCSDETSSLRALETHLLNHTKHYTILPASLESFAQWLDIGKILAQGKELAGSKLMTIGVAVVSPLTLTGLNGNLLLSACAHGFTIVPTICPMSGSTAPYTIASTLLLGHTENLFMAALTQIVNPGNPFQYAMGASVTNMQAGYDMYYTLDKVLWKMASVQLARKIRIPVFAECGGTMTYRYDQQNGAEGMIFMLSAHASGADILAGIGSTHNANGMSAEMMLIQTAWLEAAKYLRQGINTDALHLGVENIRSAGPGGEFLTDDLTLKYMRGGEFFANDLLDLSGGHEDGPSILERAHDRAEEMVSGYESPVPGQVQEDLRKYFHDEYRKITAH